MRFRVVAKLLGALLVLLSVFMLGCGLFDYAFDADECTNGLQALSIGAGVTFTVGLLLFCCGLWKIDRVSRREGVVIVGLGWILSALFGAIPFYYCDPLPGLGEQKLDIVASIFESASGITATGSTNLNNIEAWPKSLLLWRAVSQWLGGLGILVIFVALMSYLGMGAKSLFRNESSFQTGEASVARIRDTAAMILRIYLVITLVCALGLMALGMTVFDAVAHAFTTVSTGGFSPKQESIAFYSRWSNGWAIELWLSVFMIICSVSFLVWVVLLKKRWTRLKNEEEGRYFVLWCVFVTLLIFIGVVSTQDQSWVISLRQAWFNTVSMASTTGYATADYTLWPAFAPLLLMLAVSMGGCSGSTTGGYKMSRIIVMTRTVLHEIVRAFRPNKVERIQVNGNRLSNDAQRQIMVFLVLYFVVFMAAVIIVSFAELTNPRVPVDIDCAIGMVVGTLFNGGPGIGSVGPVNNFAHLEPATKMFLSLLMIVGRLELYTVLVLFVPSLWKKY